MTVHSRNNRMNRVSKRNRWNQFYGFVQDASSPAEAGSIAELEGLSQDLKAMGIDVDRVGLAVAGIVSMGRSQARNGWLERARRAQNEFERSVRRKSSWISGRFASARDMAAAISSGQLGPGVQKQAMVFFRNGSGVAGASDQDLRSFLNDCELLGLISDAGGPGARGAGKRKEPR